MVFASVPIRLRLFRLHCNSRGLWRFRAEILLLAPKNEKTGSLRRYMKETEYRNRQSFCRIHSEYSALSPYTVHPSKSGRLSVWESVLSQPSLASCVGFTFLTLRA
jgi:hypothetical protein